MLTTRATSCSVAGSVEQQQWASGSKSNQCQPSVLTRDGEVVASVCLDPLPVDEALSFDSSGWNCRCAMGGSPMESCAVGMLVAVVICALEAKTTSDQLQRKLFSWTLALRRCKVT
jgi:hypothetical protein